MATRQETVTVKGFTLVKDLQEDERLCTTCHGAGLMIRNYPYGLSGERRTDGKLFPYNKPHIGHCPDCYVGVQTLCQHCDKPMLKSRLTCECPAAKAGRDAEDARKLQEKADKATKLTEAEAGAAGIEMVYSEGHDRYYSWDELADVEPEEVDTLGIVWATTETQISLDASDIIDNASEELHEDARDTIGNNAQQELQALLDTWSEKHGAGTKTYYPDYGRVVVIEQPAKTPEEVA